MSDPTPKAPLYAAINKALQAVEPIRKDTAGNRGKYASLAGALEVIERAFLPNDLIVLQPIQMNADGTMYIETMICHTVSGECLISQYPLSVEENKAIAGAQAVGSAITYGRRYSLLAAVGLAPEDDDGQAASQSRQGQQQQQSRQPSNVAPRPPQSSTGASPQAPPMQPASQIALTPEAWRKRIEGTPEIGYKTLVIDARKAFADNPDLRWMMYELIDRASDIDVVEKLYELAMKDGFPEDLSNHVNARLAEQEETVTF